MGAPIAITSCPGSEPRRSCNRCRRRRSPRRPSRPWATPLRPGVGGSRGGERSAGRDRKNEEGANRDGASVVRGSCVPSLSSQPWTRERCRRRTSPALRFPCAAAPSDPCDVTRRVPWSCGESPSVVRGRTRGQQHRSRHFAAQTAPWWGARFQNMRVSPAPTAPKAVSSRAQRRVPRTRGVVDRRAVPVTPQQSGYVIVRRKTPTGRRRRVLRRRHDLSVPRGRVAGPPRARIHDAGHPRRRRVRRGARRRHARVRHRTGRRQPHPPRDPTRLPRQRRRRTRRGGAGESAPR